MHVIHLYSVTQVFILSLNLSHGLYWFLFPCSLVICNDIAAYICGRWFGRTRLISLSPNKTLEGYIGACFITLLFGRWTQHQIPDHMQYHGVILALYASLVAPFGGFLASALKRAKGIKDFDQQFIPGHGGMSDRMDCQLLIGFFTLVYLHSVVI
ncbi:phosphatidate cytidylyltransferase [Halteromyces radiatus]|uniref:phosphatidate cytidylyltransferase n=1 Tax=Halteromyces radiatus TaxID=101107 RepID=UPI00221E524F|nr:phosphatidate cytidylyltransferase [Halteromyces radiatus]KAI8088789.1 phosphatidate cytidylyltransferase [Halteromyces radiatus]